MNAATAQFLTDCVYRNWLATQADNEEVPASLRLVVDRSQWRSFDRLERIRILVGDINPATDFPELWREWSAGRALNSPDCPEALWWPPIEAVLKQHAGIRLGAMLTECLAWLAQDWTPNDIREAVEDGVRALKRKETKCAKNGEAPPPPNGYVRGVVNNTFERRRQALAQAARPVDGAVRTATGIQFEEVPL